MDRIESFATKAGKNLVFVAVNTRFTGPRLSGHEVGQLGKASRSGFGRTHRFTERIRFASITTSRIAFTHHRRRSAWIRSRSGPLDRGPLIPS